MILVSPPTMKYEMGIMDVVIRDPLCTVLHTGTVVRVLLGLESMFGTPVAPCSYFHHEFYAIHIHISGLPPI